jgi:flagellar hook assembly protein FlgD
MSTDNASLPKSFELKQNYPNPFNPSTDIVFSLEQTSDISLTIFNVLGQKVKVLANESKQAGTHSLSWDGRDEMGALVSTGLYFYTLTDGSKSITKKMALMK